MFEYKAINALLIIIGFWTGSYAITALLNLVGRVMSKTASDLDDKITEAVKLPIRYLAVILGFYFAAAYYGIGWSWRGVGIDAVFFSSVILILGFAASRILKVVLRWYTDHDRIRKSNQTIFIFIRKMASVFVYTIVLLLILQELGIQIGPLLAGLGVAGLAVALGLQEPLSNLFAALFLAMDKSVNVGDWIQLEDGTKAFIEDISWRSVTIRTREGNAVIIPNAVFVGQKITSYDYPESEFFSSLRVGVAYGSDLDLVEATALRAAELVLRAENIPVESAQPRVRFRQFGESSIDFDLRVRINRARDEGKFRHALIKTIKREFDAARIEIPFPQRVVYRK